MKEALSPKPQQAAYRLHALPFEPPRGCELVETYAVRFSLPSGNRRHDASFGVYLFRRGGLGLYYIREPLIQEEARLRLEAAITSLSTWLEPTERILSDPVGLLEDWLKNGAGLPKDEGLFSACHYYLVRDLLGYGPLDPLLRDPEVEEVSCEAPSRPVKVWHRRFNAFEWLESNLTMEGPEALDGIVARLAYRSGRPIATSTPILDATLPEGHRVSASWQTEISPQGSSFTVRKFREKPYTITELIALGSLSSEIAAHLWAIMEFKGFILVAGTAASGKTTLLNSLATVLHPNWKVASVEDVREINLPHSGWKPLATRPGSADGMGRIDLEALARFALRERPDFIIVGEARGPEARVLFQSSATGHGALATFHAANLEGLVARLTNPPISVEGALLRLIDAVVFMARQSGSSKRLVAEVIGNVEGWQPIYRWDGLWWEKFPGDLARLEKLAAAHGVSPRGVEEMVSRRIAFLEGLAKNKVFGYAELAAQLRRFYEASSAP